MWRKLGLFGVDLVRDSIPRRHLDHCLPQDREVESQGTTVEILLVEPHLFGTRKVVSTVDLCPAGQSRHQRVHAARGAQCDEVVLIEQGGSGTNETHLTTKNAPELRDFVEA